MKFRMILTLVALAALLLTHGSLVAQDDKPKEDPPEEPQEQQDPRDIKDMTVKEIKDTMKTWLEAKDKESYQTSHAKLMSQRINPLEEIWAEMKNHEGFTRYRIRLLANVLLQGGAPPKFLREFFDSLDGLMDTNFWKTLERPWDHINNDANNTVFLVLDPYLDRAKYMNKPFECRKKGISTAELMEEMCDQADLSYLFIYGVAFFSTPERIDWFVKEGITEWKSQRAHWTGKYIPRFSLHFDMSYFKDEDPEWRLGLLKQLRGPRAPFETREPLSVQDFIEKTLKEERGLAIEVAPEIWEKLPENAKKVEMKTGDIFLYELLGLILTPFDLGFILKDEAIHIVHRKDVDKAWVKRLTGE